MEANVLSFVRGRQGHSGLDSGHHGDLWFQLETLCLYSRGIQPFAAQLASRLVQHNVQLVCVPLVEGAFIALLVSLELGCNFVYAERFANIGREGLSCGVPPPRSAAVRGQR
jgi:orotate phosphoribosyltransferase